MMAACTQTKNNPFLEEWNTPYGIPPFEKIQLTDYIPAVKAGIEEQNKELEAILNNQDAPTFENTVAACELSGRTLTKTTAVLFNLQETEGSDEMNKVVEEATALMTEHEDNISMNKAFFERVKAVYDADQSGLTREQQMVLKKLYQSFTRNGVDLDEAAQARLKEINQKIAAAQQKFGTNLLAENNAFKEQFGLPVSSYTSEMTSCEDRNRREAMFKAYSSRGNNGNEYDNKALCLEILKLRAEKARLLGFDNFAAYQLDNKMAHDPATVDAFLDRIIGPAVAKAKEEVADMQVIMDEDIQAGKVAAGSRIEPWDWFYYAEKVRQRKYSLDENLTKPYFRMENVRNGIFFAANKLYGISVEPLKDVPLYNPAVEAFKVIDADGSLLGIFSTDYFPRSSKRGGAWMTNFREQYVDAQGNDVRPIVINVCNMTAPTDSLPALFTIDEVETVFHEFGHGLHHMLTRIETAGVSGISGVPWDAVELPSQFMENWCWEPEALAFISGHYETGEPLPKELLDKMLAAKNYQAALFILRQLEFGLFDFRLHAEFRPDQGAKILETLAEIKKLVAVVPSPSWGRFPHAFSHIFAGGYAAGYYSYLWADVLAADAFSRFEEEGIFNRETGQSFLDNILSRGGSEEPMELFKRFRGREPQLDAMLEHYGIKG